MRACLEEVRSQKPDASTADITFDLATLARTILMKTEGQGVLALPLDLVDLRCSRMDTEVCALKDREL